MARLFFWTLLGYLVVGLGACTTNAIIPLEYHAKGGAVGGCDQSMALSIFRDVRTQQGLGVASDGSRLEAAGDVADWVSRGLYDELRLAGCQVTYHETAGDFPADLNLSGEIERLWLKQYNVAEYQVHIKLSLIIRRSGRPLERKDFVYANERLVAPGFTKAQDVLRSALQELLRDMVPKIVAEKR